MIEGTMQLNYNVLVSMYFLCNGGVSVCIYNDSNLSSYLVMSMKHVNVCYQAMIKLTLLL